MRLRGLGGLVVLDLVEALCGCLADVPNPLGRSLGQFRMVLLRPGTLGSAQRITLAIELDLPLG